MAKKKQWNKRHKSSKYKSSLVSTQQRYAQTNLVKMENRLLPFVKKDENGKVVGVEFSQDTAGPLCPRCMAPMELKKPKDGDRWKPFWGCSQFAVTGCKGSDKDKLEKKSPERNQSIEPSIASIVGNQNKLNEPQIVKQNKDGKLIVNRSIQSESNGTLSWGDVLDLIDDALDDGVYPDETVNDLNTFREQTLNKIQAERGLFEVRRAPKSPVKPKEEPKAYTKPAGHTYFLTQQLREFKEKRKAAKAEKAAKLAEGIKNGLAPNQQKSTSKKKKKKEKKFLITPMSYVKPGGLKCPLCKAAMTKKEPKAGQDWKPFWGCVEFPRCRGTRQIEVKR